MFSSRIFLCTITFGSAASGSRSEELTKSWSAGKASWKAARDPELWDEPNACDPAVLNGSAPLTVLFGLSSVWGKIEDMRQENGNTGQPLEIHVLGSSYPFEGRSDWSLLAQQRPANIPQVRVRLILGTPFQTDNVPPIEGQPHSFVQSEEKIKPIAGRWSQKRQEIVCPGLGKFGTAEIDKTWSKNDLCRDYGNGLEVVCIEQFYQDVRDELPRPDLAVMFSPGFPQLARRSWDGVLIGLLNDRVPTMISDVVSLPSWGRKLNPGKSAKYTTVLAGGKWDPSAELGEDWQTWMAMQKYGAHVVKSRRGPFPILHQEDGEVLAKNAIVQIYQGYKPGKRPIQPVPQAQVEKHNKLLARVDWKRFKKCSDEDLNMTKVFSFPTSKSFDNALRDLYIEDLRERVKRKQSSFNSKQRAELEKYGLLGEKGKMGKGKRWGLRAWLVIFSTVGCDVLI